ncbi:hypothetical protein BZA77DRAFT_166706 [Pyronema omphalodes]|nr:hypothetical protein BZA77DRAFT_166706 [Pyronema omphalodes]
MVGDQEYSVRRHISSCTYASKAIHKHHQLSKSSKSPIHLSQQSCPGYSTLFFSIYAILSYPILSIAKKNIVTYRFQKPRTKQKDPLRTRRDPKESPKLQNKQAKTKLPSLTIKNPNARYLSHSYKFPDQKKKTKFQIPIQIFLSKFHPIQSYIKKITQKNIFPIQKK